MSTAVSIITFETRVKTFCDSVKLMNREPSKKAYQMEALIALYQVISHIESNESDYSIEEVKKVLSKTTTFAECVFLVYNNYKIEEKDTQTVDRKSVV